jgi:hypothetical protein
MYSQHTCSSSLKQCASFVFLQHLYPVVHQLFSVNHSVGL